MTDIHNHPVYSKNVLEMITVANDYCLTLTKAESTSTTNLVDYLQKVFSLIYLKCSLLPDIVVENREANERFLTEEDWETMFNTLRNKLKKDDEFWVVDASANHHDPIKISLAECLTDIFQELKDFLLLYQKSSLDAKENAVYELSISFANDLGYNLLDAHRQIHYIKMRGFPQDTELNIPEMF